jgi:hypothetical protein
MEVSKKVIVMKPIKTAVLTLFVCLAVLACKNKTGVKNVNEGLKKTTYADFRSKFDWEFHDIDKFNGIFFYIREGTCGQCIVYTFSKIESITADSVYILLDGEEWMFPPLPKTPKTKVFAKTTDRADAGIDVLVFKKRGRSVSEVMQINPNNLFVIDHFLQTHEGDAF